MKILKKLQRYMGKRKLLLPLSMFLSALSELAGIVPYLLIWMILKSLLEKESLAGNVSLYAWLAAGFAAGGRGDLFCCSHVIASCRFPG